ncbi:nicotinamide-nucleotide amidase [uncultured Nitrosomonas sp.]|uniref:nicotinamide-nucleotide amidase n=1 Tax=uncultured Nitrosomonas sp. TaxID=156424 RepID=UPI00263336BC|nr:nicotinamide-nucleotide amidase [uncultured Nitrosomonas sp.]
MLIVPDDAILLELARQVGKQLEQHGLKLVSAESCTGGWIGQIVTAIPGSSAWYDRGFITYSNAAKQQMLHVQPQTLTQFGAVSEQTAREMAQGALATSQAHIAVSVTGIAGPDGGSAEKPVGTVCFAWLLENLPNRTANSQTCHFSGDREAIRRQSVATALQGMLELLKNSAPVNLA